MVLHCPLSHVCVVGSLQEWIAHMIHYQPGSAIYGCNSIAIEFIHVEDMRSTENGKHKEEQEEELPHKRRKKDTSHELLLLHKPRGWTPLQTLNKLREINPLLANEKLSYAGRLDPMARGEN